MLSKIIRRIARDATIAGAETFGRRPAVALRAEIQRRVTAEAADYVTEHMPDALFCADKMVHLDHALQHLAGGVVAEFGVYKGTTINHIAGRVPDRTVFGFDSFRGLPEKWTGFRFKKNDFDRGGRKPRVAGNVTLIEGWFDDTVPEFCAALTEPLAFAHIDCDIYSSTRTVLDRIAPHLVAGSIIVFDEFFNYPGYRLHEFKAFHEFVETYSVEFTFIGYSGQQVSLAIAEIKA